eukprot:11162448-Lingulodinium_polyedra.AAC.1
MQVPVMCYDYCDDSTRGFQQKFYDDSASDVFSDHGVTASCLGILQAQLDKVSHSLIELRNSLPSAVERSVDLRAPAVVMRMLPEVVEASLGVQLPPKLEKVRLETGQ